MDFVELARFWGDYLLDVEVVALRRRTRVGPFMVEREGTEVLVRRMGDGVVLPLGCADGPPIGVTLDGVLHQLRRIRRPARFARDVLLKRRSLLSILSTIAVVVLLLGAAFRAVPELGAEDDRETEEELTLFLSQQLPSDSPASWGLTSGRGKVDFELPLGIAEVVDLPSCNDEFLPTCPEGIRGQTIKDSLSRASLLEFTLAVIDGQLARDSKGRLILSPLGKSDSGTVVLLPRFPGRCERWDDEEDRRVLVGGWLSGQTLLVERACGVGPGPERVLKM